MCITSCSIYHSDQIQYRHNSTLATGKVGCLVGRVALLVACLEGLVLSVVMAGVAKYIRETSFFGLQAMLEGSLDVSGPFTFQISCGT